MRTVVRRDCENRGHHTFVTRVTTFALVLVGVAALAVSAQGSANRLPGLMTSKAPWPANNRALLHARLEAMGLPALRAEGQRLHIHQHLDIAVRGKVYAVPAGIGIDYRERFISPLHTHDYTGIMHVESPTVRKFTLGQWFDVWGLRFSTTSLGGYTAKGEERVWMFVNGKRWLGNPRQLVLKEHQEIVVAFGTRASIPKPIPSSFPFPPGL